MDKIEELINAFETILLTYQLVIKFSESDVKFDTIQLLAKNLNRPITYLQLRMCNLVTSTLILKVIENDLIVNLVNPNKKRKRNLNWSKICTNLSEIFKLHLQDYIKHHGENSYAHLLDLIGEDLEVTLYFEKRNKQFTTNDIPQIVDRFQKLHKDKLYMEVSKKRDAIYGSQVTNDNKTMYLHQEEALIAIENQKHVIITTSTSSGKSLVYQTAIRNEWNINPLSTSLLLFPTKALSQDQYRGIQKQLGEENIEIYNFDGDTLHDMTTRKRIVDNATILLTNPDMLHVSMLPYHKNWRRFFLNLRFIVVDEFHSYQGRFGAHVSFVMKRLQRICHYYGNTKFQFICCSATLSNPKEHMSVFFGFRESDIMDITNDTSPKGDKYQIVWNPSTKNLYQSPFQELDKLLPSLINNQIRTIVFTKSRLQCEMVYKDLTEYYNDSVGVMDQIMTYRAGYSIQDRRNIEKRLFDGDLTLVIATNALELGIDIGSLDAVVHVGYPGTYTSYVQQSGRAGRRSTPSLNILLLDTSNSLDMLYANKPNLLFDKSYIPEVVLPVDHHDILDIQLSCAAREFPLVLSDEKYFASTDGVTFLEFLKDYLQFDSVLNGYIPKFKYMNQPAFQNPIRSIDSKAFNLIDSDSGKLIEEMDLHRASKAMYLHAVHLHKGLSYIVIKCDFENCKALAKRIHVDYITKPIVEVKIDPIAIQYTKEYPKFKILMGPMIKLKTAKGFKKLHFKSNQLIEKIESHPEESRYNVFGMWIEFAGAYDSMLQLPIVLKHLQRMIRYYLPLHIESRSLSLEDSPKGVSKLMFYDISNTSSTIRLLCDKFEHILQTLNEILVECQCEHGCQMCMLNLTHNLGVGYDIDPYEISKLQIMKIIDVLI